MPMIPTNGLTDERGFGPDGAAQLGNGGYAGADMMGGDPTDPTAALNMQALAPVEPQSIAEAMQAAIEQRQMELDAQQQEEKRQLLMADLQEAAAFAQEMMAVVGQEATTADGGGMVAPAPAGEAPMGPPGGGTGMAEAMTGMGGPMGMAAPPDLRQLMGG